MRQAKSTLDDAIFGSRMNIWKILIACLAMTAAASVAPAYAQEKVRSVGIERDWSIFESDQQCWIFSAPKSTENTRNGKRVSVKRGDIGLFVAFKKGETGNSSVSFSGGYPFRKDSVRLSLGSNEYRFLTGEEGSAVEWAWPMPVEEDRLVDGMKKGSRAVVRAVSQRSTNTKDTFSLLGFTAALEKAKNRCN